LDVGVDYFSGFSASSFFLPRDASLIRGAGIAYLRLSFGPSSLSNLETLVPAVVGQNLKIIGLLYNRAALDANNIDAWGAWVRSTVATYKDYVKVWEVWNEPDLNTGFGPLNTVGNVTKYVEWLKVAYQNAKAEDYSCTVLGGSLSSIRPATLDWLNSMYDLGAQNYMDALSVHAYSGTASPLPYNQATDGKAFWKVQNARDIMVQRGDGNKKIWITEMGWPSTAVGSTLQAAYLRDALSYANANWNEWLEALVIYQWQDGGGFNFGLMYSDDSLKPSYYEVVNWIWAPTGATYSLVLNIVGEAVFIQETGRTRLEQ